MEFVEAEVVMLNVLIQSDINTVIKLCKEFVVNKKYVNNLIILKYRAGIDSWLDEYNEVKDSTIDTDDIIKISLIEKERYSNIDILYPNDGTIIMKFPDGYPAGYDPWFLPKN